MNVRRSIMMTSHFRPARISQRASGIQNCGLKEFKAKIAPRKLTQRRRFGFHGPLRTPSDFSRSSFFQKKTNDHTESHADQSQIQYVLNPVVLRNVSGNRWRNAASENLTRAHHDSNG